ncbi:MAG: AbrB/MazE/SpoVT family DNA-binding domain-containing protein [Nanoarchaeota archaeon]|nr:AbrB/MazE/SpoVT family DNA-binding domain-containing protein [Nanoarchaeota archaeon]
MKRKVIQMAGKTMVVSLPAEWVKKYGVKKGDEIELSESGQRMIISTTKQYETSEKAQIDASNLNERALEWTLSALHKSGYDEIVINYKKPETIKIIEKYLKTFLMGFIIMSHADNKCVLKSITKNVESEFDSTLRRAFLVTISLGEETLKCIKEKKFSELLELVHYEQTNNQLTNFCERLINKGAYKNHKHTCFMYVINWNLEKICDNYKYICKYLEKTPVKLNEVVLKFFEETNAYFKAYYSLFYNFDLQKLTELSEKKKILINKAMEMNKTKNYKEIVVIHHLMNIIAQTSDFSSSMVALNQE